VASNDPKSPQDVIDDGGNIGQVLRSGQNDAFVAAGCLRVIRIGD
jgi:hypothetical protein